MLKLLSFMLLCGSVHATTFSVQPIERQIKESDGIIQGHYLRKKFVLLDDGKIATQMMFKMKKEVGMESELFGMDEVIVHYPGGTYKGTHMHVDGLPDFVSGEKVVLFIRNVDNRYWGMNLGFGSFKVINYGRDTMLVNFLFPQHPKVGQVSLENFEKAVKEIKGNSFKVVTTPAEYPTNSPPDKNRLPASLSETNDGQNRSIASKSEQSENEDAQPNMSMFWLLTVLGLTGGIFRWTRIKSSR